jgi:hypothetical protein
MKSEGPQYRTNINPKPNPIIGAAGKQVGLVINFNVPVLARGIVRMVL